VARGYTHISMVKSTVPTMGFGLVEKEIQELLPLKYPE
jgi:hypothetical protein